MYNVTELCVVREPLDVQDRPIDFNVCLDNLSFDIVTKL